jgi:hypothetical protein
VTLSAATSSRRPCIDHDADPHAIAGDRRLVAKRGQSGTALLRHHQLGFECIFDRAGRPDPGDAVADIEQDRVAFADHLADAADAAQHGHAHGARDDDDVGGQRSFLQDHAFQLAAIIFEEFGRPQVARDQDRLVRQPHLRRGAELP